MLSAGKLRSRFRKTSWRIKLSEQLREDQDKTQSFLECLFIAPFAQRSRGCSRAG